jgi:chemotaxis protein MotB
MVTFSDCMTLLLTFFVLLISFSSFDVKTFRRMEAAIAEGLPSIGLRLNNEVEAFRSKPEVALQEPPEAGSESPTVDGQYESNPTETLDFLDFQRQKIFLMPSENVFWGQGTRISGHGRRVFTDVAALIETLPNRVVISEHGFETDHEESELGLRRAWQVVRLLSTRHGLDQTRFSVSGAGTVAAESIVQSGLFEGRTDGRRVVEVAILDRSLYR